MRERSNCLDRRDLVGKGLGLVTDQGREIVGMQARFLLKDQALVPGRAWATGRV
jgi:hypothetical protein